MFVPGAAAIVCATEVGFLVEEFERMLRHPEPVASQPAQDVERMSGIIGSEALPGEWVVDCGQRVRPEGGDVNANPVVRCGSVDTDVALVVIR